MGRYREMAGIPHRNPATVGKGAIKLRGATDVKKLRHVFQALQAPFSSMRMCTQFRRFEEAVTQDSFGL